MNNKFKMLLKTTAAVATLFAGSQTWGALLDEKGNAFSTASPSPGVYLISTSANYTLATTTLTSGKYIFRGVGDITCTSLTLVNGTTVTFETAGDVTLTAAVMPSDKSAKIIFDNSGTVTWTANPTNTNRFQTFVFGKSCTGLTGVNTAVDAVFEVLNPDFAITTGPIQPYLLKSTSVGFAGVGADVIHIVK